MLNLYQVELLSMGTMCSVGCVPGGMLSMYQVEVLSVYKVGC
jgi:hypothetical protein